MSATLDSFLGTPAPLKKPRCPECHKTIEANQDKTTIVTPAGHVTTEYHRECYRKKMRPGDVRCEIKCPDQDAKTCKLPGAHKLGCRKCTEIGMSFTQRGKCKGCGEQRMLHSFEGTYDDPDDMMCEGCIDEYHDRVHEAEDAMASMQVDTDAMADEEGAAEELGGDEEY